MSDKYFVDTNILMYAHDRLAARKHEKAKALVGELWNARSGVLSTQVLQEFCVNIRKKTKHPPTTSETRDIVSDYLRWEVVVNTADATIEALDLETRFQVSFWDALIIHAANVAGATILYSEDLSDGQVYGSVRAINPFNAA
jgi:predicted nucleic acid-binding protein